MFPKNKFKPSKPGKTLKPLLTENEKQTADIAALSYDFACRAVRLYQYLTETPQSKEYTLSKQILRSGTSIGANVSEAQNAQSRADFLAKMTIASKEANETSYWLNLLHDNGYLTDPQFTSLNHDMERILCKLVAIVKTTSENLQKQKAENKAK
jgi:four helix bundle protein